MALKISLSFKENEVEMYEYIKTKRNASCYIKDLIEKDMRINNYTRNKKEEKSNNDSNDLELDF